MTKGNDGVKKELKTAIEGSKVEGHAIFLESVYAAMKYFSEDKEMMNKWMGDRKVCYAQSPRLCPCQGYLEGREEGPRRR